MVEVTVIAADEDVALVFEETIDARGHQFAGARLDAGQMEAGEAGARHGTAGAAVAGRIGGNVRGVICVLGGTDGFYNLSAIRLKKKQQKYVAFSYSVQS